MSASRTPPKCSSRSAWWKKPRGRTRRWRSFSPKTKSRSLAVTLFDLVKTLQTVLERAKNRPIYEVGKEDVSVPDMIRYLENVFRELRTGESLSGRPSCSSASAAAAP